jgi:DNA replication licensing factor MCM2
MDSVDPVKDVLLAHFVVGRHLRSHLKFEADKEEMDVATSLDEDVCIIRVLLNLF